ncbi:hypothetical protein B0H19DRAFT_1224918 [Mycena capillaripes]|nr:hypothetical protein B0H19DRAFT_1224918 [Mycena capillaripes]
MVSMNTTYIIYSVCPITNRVYSLNVFDRYNAFPVDLDLEPKLWFCELSFKLQYNIRVSISRNVLAPAKRGSALGHWDDAAKDYDTALAFQPGNTEIGHGMQKLSKVRRKTCACAEKHRRRIGSQRRGGKKCWICLEEEFLRRVEDRLSGTKRSVHPSQDSS